MIHIEDHESEEETTNINAITEHDSSTDEEYIDDQARNAERNLMAAIKSLDNCHMDEAGPSRPYPGSKPLDIKLTHEMQGKTLPYVNIMIGTAPYQGIKLKGLTDTGCSKTLINKELWNAIPGKENVSTLKHKANLVCAEGPGKVQDILIAELWITLESTNGKQISFRHPVEMYTGLNDQCYVGYDILGGPRTLFQTPHNLAIKANVNAEYKLNIAGGDDDLFIIPLHTEANRGKHPKPVPIEIGPNTDQPQPMDQNEPEVITLTMTESILVPPKNLKTIIQRATSNKDIPDTYLEHELYHGVAATMVSIEETNEVAITIYNEHPTPIEILRGQQFHSEKHRKSSRVTTRLNMIDTSSLTPEQREITEDPNLEEDEKEDQLEDLEATGFASISATQYISTHPKVQVLEPRKVTTDYSDEQLITGIPLSHLEQDVADKVRQMFKGKMAMLARNEFDVEATPIITAEIHIKPNATPMSSKYIPVPINLQEDAQRLIEYYLHKGVLEPSTEPSPFLSNMIYQRKKSGKIRGILDARIINLNTVKMASTTTSMQEVTSHMMGKKYHSTIDVSNAYFSISLTKESRKHTAFQTIVQGKRQRLQYTCCPQGFINSGHFLDQLMSTILGDLEDVLYVADDILVSTNRDLQHHLDTIATVCDRLIQAKLKANHTKLSILSPHTEFLGFVYKHNEVTIPKLRLQAYIDYPLPKTSKQAKTLLASLSYYRKFIPRFAVITQPIHEYAVANLKSLKEPHYAEVKSSLEQLKTTLQQTVALRLPDSTKPYICHSDASNKAIAFAVSQPASEKFDPASDVQTDLVPVAFLSKMLSRAEQKYSTFKKEALALTYGLTAMSHFMLNHPKIIVYTDARSLLYLRACRNSNPYLTRLALTLCQYNIELYHLKGSLNLTADALSRHHRKMDSMEAVEDQYKPMSEKEATQLVNRLTLQRDTHFTKEEVFNLLTGDSLPAMKQKTTVKKPASQAAKYFKQQDSQPEKKGPKKVHLPPLRRNNNVTIYEPFNHEELLDQTMQEPIITTTEELDICITGMIPETDVTTTHINTITTHNTTTETPEMTEKRIKKERELKEICERSAQPILTSKENLDITEGQSTGKTLQDIAINCKVLQAGAISLKTFKHAQALAPYIKEAMKTLTEKKSPYKMVDGIMYRMTEANQMKPLLPDSLMEAMVFNEHHSQYGQHRSYRAIYRNIARKYYHPRLADEIRKYTSNCYHCIANKPFPQPKTPLETRLDVKEPRLLWSYDACQGLPETTRGNKMIHILVEHLSLYTLLVPQKDKSTESLMETFKKHLIMPFTAPAGIRMDREPGIVTSEKMRNFMEEHRIEILPTSPRHPQTNGQTEVKVKAIKALLRTYTAQTGKEWDEDLHLIAMAANKTTNTMGYTSEEVMFGNITPTPGDLIHHQLANVTDLDSYMSAIAQNVYAIRQEIGARRQAKRKQNETYHNKTRRSKVHEKGDIVMITNDVIQGQSSLQCKLKGPYIIMEVDNTGRTAIVETLDQTTRPTKAHFDQIRPIKQIPYPAALNPKWDNIITQTTEEAKAKIQRKVHNRAEEGEDQPEVPEETEHNNRAERTDETNSMDKQVGNRYNLRNRHQQLPQNKCK